MKYLKQMGIILCIAFLGEIMKAILPLPVPANIYGILFMLGALLSGVLKVDQIRETSNFLIEIMPILFVPVSVGLMDSWEILKGSWIQYFVIAMVSTVAVMVISGKVTQFVIQRKKGDREDA